MGKTKSAENSRKCREGGNLNFKRGYFKLALEHYNEALLEAPTDFEELYLALSNRIAANLELRNFEACIRDGYRILENTKGRDDNTVYTNLRIKSANRIKKAKERLDKQSSKGHDSKPKQSVELYKGANERVHALSEAVTIGYSKKKGRHLVATQDIPVGSVVLMEPPYGSVLLPHCAEIHCRHCHRELPPDPLPCETCSDRVWYCSEMCRFRGWTEYHWVECGSVEKMECLGIAHMALRMLLVTDPKQLVELEPGNKNEIDESWAQFGANGETYSFFSYDTVARLKSHHENTVPEDLEKYKEVATALTKFLTLRQYFEKSKWPEGCDETKKTTVTTNNLVRLIEQCICNAHAVTKTVDTLEKLKTLEKSRDDIFQSIEEEGTNREASVTLTREMLKTATGLYPTGSLMNHACKPNIFSSFIDGRTLVIRTTSEVKKGDELKNCYGPRFGKMKREERQEGLEQQYFFKCDCPEACNNEEAKAKEKETVGLMCPKCKVGPALKLIEGEPDYKQRAVDDDLVDVKCVNCGANSEINTSVIQSLDLTIDSTLNMLAKNASTSDGSVQKLLMDLENLAKELHPMNQSLMLLRDRVAKYCTEADSYEESKNLVEENLKYVERMFGIDSIEVAEEILKIIDLLKILKWRQEKFVTDIIAYTKRAAHIYSVYYGPNFPLVKELQGNFELC